ncbi:hypothetical protein EG329_003947 [Mollisiaceae sp. DMI_Dod_QoI]|nr:hypothetical protein EG329_003947 [Helotiales sp. DMI_Dod_QoI]
MSSQTLSIPADDNTTFKSLTDSKFRHQSQSQPITGEQQESKDDEKRSHSLVPQQTLLRSPLRIPRTSIRKIFDLAAARSPSLTAGKESRQLSHEQTPTAEVNQEQKDHSTARSPSLLVPLDPPPQDLPFQSPAQDRTSPAALPSKERKALTPRAEANQKKIVVIDLVSDSEDENPEPPKKKRRLDVVRIDNRPRLAVENQSGVLGKAIHEGLRQVLSSEKQAIENANQAGTLGDGQNPDLSQISSMSLQAIEGLVRKESWSKEQFPGPKQTFSAPAAFKTLGPQDISTEGPFLEAAKKEKPVDDKTGNESLASSSICNVANLKHYTSMLLTLDAETRASKRQDVAGDRPDVPKSKQIPSSDSPEILKLQKSEVGAQPSDLKRSSQLKRPNKDVIKSFVRRLKTPPKTSAVRTDIRFSKPGPKRKRKAKKPLVEPKTSTGRKRGLRDVYEDIQDEDINSIAWRLAIDKMIKKNDSSNGSQEEHTMEGNLSFDTSSSFVTNVLKANALNNEKQEDGSVRLYKIPTWEYSQLPSLEADASFASSSSSQSKKPPTFLKPLPDVVQIAIGFHIFSVHEAIFHRHCPVLAGACSASGGQLPEILADVGVDVFGLLVNWLYGQVYRLRAQHLLLNSAGKPSHQHRLMKLWILAGRLRLPRLQNEAIDMLDVRVRSEKRIQTKYFENIYSNTTRGDGLRRYIVDKCLASSFAGEVSGGFPKELQQEMFEATLIKHEVDGEVQASGMARYYVIEGSAGEQRSK